MLVIEDEIFDLDVDVDSREGRGIGTCLYRLLGSAAPGQP